MKSRSNLFLSAFLAVFLLTGTTAVTVTVATEVAEAARFGGGKSFGGKSFMKRPAAQPSMANKPQAAQQQAGMAAAAPAARSGLFGGMGGMFGGLLAGSLIGSMLFGGGMGGGMGGFMDILIFGGLLFLLFKFLSRRKAASAAATMRNSAATASNPMGSNHAYQQASPAPGGMSWESLTSASPAAEEQALPQAPTAANVPADFNQQEFLEGAKAAYVRLNTAWDKRDLQDITNFATPAFMEEIRTQAAEDPTPSTTEIMLVNANLTEVVREGDEQMASVFFTVLLRETAGQTAPADVREMWHFVRNADGTGMWRVDGIQQIN